MKQCLFCGKHLETKIAKKVYCDDKCRIAYFRLKKQAKNNIGRVNDAELANKLKSLLEEIENKGGYAPKNHQNNKK